MPSIRRMRIHLIILSLLSFDLELKWGRVRLAFRTKQILTESDLSIKVNNAIVVMSMIHVS